VNGRPLRVVVAGGSVSLFVVPRTGRAEGTYGELLPGLLEGDGLAVDVRHTGQWFDLVQDLRRRYESAVRNHFPDVLVLNYGMGEAQPNVIPTWAARHFQSWDRSSHPLALAYREHLGPRAWTALRRVQSRTSSWPTYRLSPGRYATELRKVITMARDETGCLVLLLDLDPPGPRWEHWVPGMAQRRDLFQQVQDDLVADLGDPDVRSVRVAHHVAEHGVDVLLPDAIHRSPLGHRLTAEALAKEVRAWAAR
jgi:lysophospholipase L1-like esterase